MSTDGALQIHATCVALDGAGILIRGPSGSGKSDLALRLLDRGAKLVADDRVDLAARDGHLAASPPESLSGLLEVRGMAIVRLEYLPDVPITIVVDLTDRQVIARLPAPETVNISGIGLPLFQIDPFDNSAITKVRLALDLALHRIMRADD